MFNKFKIPPKIGDRKFNGKVSFKRSRHTPWSIKKFIAKEDAFNTIINVLKNNNRENEIEILMIHDFKFIPNIPDNVLEGKGLEFTDFNGNGWHHSFKCKKCDYRLDVHDTSSFTYEQPRQGNGIVKVKSNPAIISCNDMYMKKAFE